MSDKHASMARRWLAILLVFTMMFTMLGEPLPTTLAALAEEAVEHGSGSSPSDDGDPERHAAAASEQASSSPAEERSSPAKEADPEHRADSADGPKEKPASEDQSSGTGSVSAETAPAQADSGAKEAPAQADSSAKEAPQQNDRDAKAEPAEARESSSANEPAPREEAKAADEPAPREEAMAADESPASTVVTEEAQPAAEKNDAAEEAQPAAEKNDAAEESQPVAEKNDAAEEAQAAHTEDTSEEPAVTDNAEGETSEEPAVTENAEGDTTEEPAVSENAEGDTTDEPAVSENAEDNSDEPAVTENAEGDTSDEPAVTENAEGDTSEEPAVSENAEGDTSEEPAVTDNAEGDTTDEPAETENPEGETSEENAGGDTPEEEAASDGAEDEGAVASLTVTAPLPPADSDGETAADGEDEQVFTTQAYTAPVTLANAEKTETKVCVLQQKIDDAMSAAKDKLSGRIRVVLETGQTYDGEVSIGPGDKPVADDFELELSTEDTGDDGLQADGSTSFTGTMTIKGIAVTIKGVGLPGKVAVSGANAKLDYYGTQKDDAVNVTVADSAEADIKTGAGGDKVTVSASDGSSANVDTGAGNDAVNATVASGGAAAIETGAGDDTVDVNVKQGAAKADISTGAGDDTVSLKNADGDVSVTPAVEASVDLGEGVNTANIDLSLADVARKVSVKGGEGSSSRVHLTGKLKSKGDNEGKNPISGTEQDLNLTAGSGNVLNVTTENVDTLTDALSNKNTEMLTSKDGNFDQQLSEAFTDYKLKVPNGQLNDVKITAPDGRKLALSSVIIDTDSVTLSDGRLTVEEGKTVLVQGLRLVLRGRDIEINGTLKADMVEIQATDGTSAHGRSFVDLYNAYNEDSNFAAAAAKAAGDAIADMINVSDKATIVIGEKSRDLFLRRCADDRERGAAGRHDQAGLRFQSGQRQGRPRQHRHTGQGLRGL